MPTLDSNEGLEKEVKRSHEHVAYLEDEIERADDFSTVKKLQHRMDIAKAYASALQRAEHYTALAVADREAAIREVEKSQGNTSCPNCEQVIEYCDLCGSRLEPLNQPTKERE